jgi:coproporphyrinogen III oxidase-like Fe-S oxidoreductase
LGLRLVEGLSLTALAQQFGESKPEQILTCLQPYQQQGWVEISSFTQAPVLPIGQPGQLGQPSRTEQRLRLTDPEGFLFSNTVLTALFKRFEP